MEQELTRLPLDYIHAANRYGQQQGSGFRIPALREFADFEYAHQLTLAVKSDIESRVEAASINGEMTTRDFMLIFNLGRATVSGWCSIDSEFLDVNQVGQQKYISEESIKSAYAWQLPSPNE